MKKLLLTTAMLLSLTACASNHTIDMEKDLIQTEISASAPDNRADAVMNGAKSIPQQVLDRGFDCYKILDIKSDSTSSTIGGGVDTMSLDLASRSISTVGGLVVATLHSGEASLKTKMFKCSEANSSNALNAKEQLQKFSK